MVKVSKSDSRKFCGIFSKSTMEILQRLGHICDALRDLVPFAHFKKREKNPWKSVNFSKVAGFSLQFTKINTLP